MMGSARLMAVLVASSTSVLEAADVLFGSNWITYKDDIEVFLAAVTPLAVWLIPQWGRDQ